MARSDLTASEGVPDGSSSTGTSAKLSVFEVLVSGSVTTSVYSSNAHPSG